MIKEEKRFGLCECGFIFEHKKGSSLCRHPFKVFCTPKEYLTKSEVEIKLGKNIKGFKSEVN